MGGGVVLEEGGLLLGVLGSGPPSDPRNIVLSAQYKSDLLRFFVFSKLSCDCAYTSPLSDTSCSDIEAEIS